MGQISISNVINVSASQANLGVNNYNTSNLLLITTDVNPASSFGTAGFKSYVDPISVATDFGTASKTAQMATAVFSQQPNILSGNGQLIIMPLLSNETYAAAITRATSLVQFFGVMVTASVETATGAAVTAAAAVIEGFAGGKMAFWVANTEANIQPSGILTGFATASQSHNRGLYYGDTSTVGGIAGLNALLMMASYAGRALSTDFSGSNTTTTMNLKTLVNVNPDPSVNQTIVNEAVTAGVDIYASIQGNPGVLSNGANGYFDDVYNLAWFVGAIQVASYNYLAQSNTKVPQTETGMSGLKGAQRQVCQQAITNGFVAPGTWNSPTTFGNQGLFFQNVSLLGYYIYTQPIAQQSQVDRSNRVAPVSQIAIKYAGAIQKQNIIVYVNP